MKGNSEIEYYFVRRFVCRFCSTVFNLNEPKEVLEKHIKKYHNDEMDFEDHCEAHKAGKCICGGVEIEL